MTTKTKSERDLRVRYDGDGLVYGAGFSADSQFVKSTKEQFPDMTDVALQEYVANADYVSHALHNVKVRMEYALERFSPDDCKLYIQEGTTFRYDVATIQPYKGNRKDARRPKYYSEIRDYMLDTWKAIPVKHIETDDALGIEQYSNKDKSTVIVSQDKDLVLGVPGWSYDPMKDSLNYTSIHDANMFHFYQMLVGDVADHVPGISRVGDKRTRDIIAACDNDLLKVRDKVQELYQKQYGVEWRPAYEEVSKLLWILRDEDQLEKGCPFLYG